MCEKCRKRAARIPQGIITAIEAHKAELVEILTEISRAANPEINAQMMEGPQGLSEEFLAITFAPYIVGYLIGEQRIHPQGKVGYASLINDGMQDGNDLLNAREVH